MDVLLFQEHKLKEGGGRKLDNIGQRLMPWCKGWTLEAELGYKNWLNLDGVGKGGVGILLTTKYATLVTATRSLTQNRVLWIKLEGIEGGGTWASHVYMCLISLHKGMICG